MSELFLRGDATPDAVLQALSTYGVAVVDGHIKDVRSAQDEFFSLLHDQANSPTFLRSNKSRVARIYKPLLDRWKNLRAALYSEFNRTIALGFYGPHKFDLNSNVYLTHDIDAMNFNAGWHNDPTRSLKFMIYLNDVDQKNGAMKYIPGSNYHGINRIVSNRMRGHDDFPVFLPSNEVPQGAVSLDGRAGTLIVFDTAGFHTAGSILPGHERMVIRGHSFPKRTLAGKIGDRVRRSAINALRHITIDDERVSERFKSKSESSPPVSN